jgi:hypothetical protein
MPKALFLIKPVSSKHVTNWCFSIRIPTFTFQTDQKTINQVPNFYYLKANTNQAVGTKIKSRGNDFGQYLALKKVQP